MQNYTQDTRLKAVLSYVAVINIVFFFSEKDNSYIRYHCAQSIVLYALMITLNILFWVLTPIPLLGFLFSIVRWLINVVWISVLVLCALRGWQGSTLRIPFVELFADIITR